MNIRLSQCYRDVSRGKRALTRNESCGLKHSIMWTDMEILSRQDNIIQAKSTKNLPLMKEITICINDIWFTELTLNESHDMR